MIHVTHDQTEVLTFADQLVVLHEGRVVQMGTPERLFETPEHTFVGCFISLPGMNLMDAEILGNQAFGRDVRVVLPVTFGYKANPADGMRANAPFFHNGSVPNLYELLLPAAGPDRARLAPFAAFRNLGIPVHQREEPGAPDACRVFQFPSSSTLVQPSPGLKLSMAPAFSSVASPRLA